LPLSDVGARGYRFIVRVWGQGRVREREREREREEERKRGGGGRGGGGRETWIRFTVSCWDMEERKPSSKTATMMFMAMMPTRATKAIKNNVTSQSISPC
jgi:hypothetical protein